MQCPKCNSDTKVKDTRGTTRRRECLAATCRHRFYTEEHAVAKVGIRSRGVPLEAGTDALARIAELERENAALCAKLDRLDRQSPRVKTQKQQTNEPSRPAAFFTRESLVPNLPNAPAEVLSVQRGWMPKLPLAAMGRMR